MKATNEPNMSIVQFEAGDIDADQFDHQAHVYIGWLYIREYGLCGTLARFDSAIRRLVKKLGAENKYHATITVFFLIIISERSRTGETWESFKMRNADLLQDSRSLLTRHYTEATIFSDDARKHFLMPDNSFETSVSA